MAAKLAILFSSALLIACVVLLASRAGQQPATAVELGEEGPHWSHKNSDDWGLTPAFAKCSKGVRQSSIDIRPSKAKTDKGLKPVVWKIKKGTRSKRGAKVVYNGHAIQAQDFQQKASLTFRGRKYNLLQVHFHTPSETWVNGRQFPLTAHFVHKSKSGKLLVFGLLFKLSSKRSSAVLNELFSSFPSGGKKKLKSKDFNIAAVTPPPPLCA